MFVAFYRLGAGQIIEENVIILSVSIIGGLIFMAMIILIVVIIVVTCYCLMARKKRKSKWRTFNFTPNVTYNIKEERIRMDDEVGTLSDSRMQSSTPYYDYIANNELRTERQWTEGISSNYHDLTLQQNVAYKKSQQNVDGLSLNVDDDGDYVISSYHSVIN